jgi:Protein of unknown function (DUF1573)/HYDIN/CFA65/VesB-like, Ig-like domain
MATSILIIACWATAATASPRIAVEQPTFDFGTIQQGKRVEHLFSIRNKGDSPLIIKNVRPSCGCTAASVTSSVIPAGGRGGIKASFNSANFSGTVQKTVAVGSNDPTIPTSMLTLRGKVVQELQIEPRQMNLGRMKVDTTFRKNLVITNRGNRIVKIASVSSSLSHVEARAERTLLKPGESSTILVSISPRSGERLLSGYLRIVTDNPDKPQILVPVYGSLLN